MNNEEKICFTIAEASRRLSIGRTALYAKLASGELVGKKCGRRTLIPEKSISALIAHLPDWKPRIPTKGQRNGTAGARGLGTREVLK
jgi:excisionase family DNA binding protein